MGNAQRGGDRDEGARVDEVGGERVDSGAESAVLRRPKAARHQQHLVTLLHSLEENVVGVRTRRQGLGRDGLVRRVRGLLAILVVRPGEREERPGRVSHVSAAGCGRGVKRVAYAREKSMTTKLTATPE